MVSFYLPSCAHYPLRNYDCMVTVTQKMGENQVRATTTFWRPSKALLALWRAVEAESAAEAASSLLEATTTSNKTLKMKAWTL